MDKYENKIWMASDEGRGAIDRFVNMEININPKNISVEVDAEAGTVKLSFVSKMAWNSLYDLEHKPGPQDQTDSVANFNACHCPNAPAIRSINGTQGRFCEKVGEPKIKRLDAWDESVVEEAAKVFDVEKGDFVDGVPREKAGQTYSSKRWSARRYQITESAVWEINLSSFFDDLAYYPQDQHDVLCHFEMEPLTSGCVKTLQTFLGEQRLSIASVKGRDDKYPRARVKSWKSNAAGLMFENSNDFNIRPKSARMEGTEGNAQGGKTKDIAWLRFSLTRNVVGPTLTVILPLWAIAAMLPFSVYFDHIGDGLTYIATLLLAIVSHRQVIDNKLSAVSRLSNCDIDFSFVMVWMLFQMVLTLSREPLDEFLIDNDVEKPSRLLFMLEVLGVVIGAFFRFNGIRELHAKFGADSSLMDQTAVIAEDMLSEEGHLSMTTYNQMMVARAILKRNLKDTDDREVAKALTRRLSCKTYLSAYIKCKHSLQEVENKAGKATSLRPVCDIFRMRFGKHEDALFGKATEVIMKHMDRVGKVETLPNESGKQFLYEMPVTNRKTIWLEVQRMEKKFSSQDYLQYKKDAFQKNAKKITSREFRWACFRSVTRSVMRLDFDAIRTDFRLTRAYCRA